MFHHLFLKMILFGVTIAAGTTFAHAAGKPLVGSPMTIPAPMEAKSYVMKKNTFDRKCSKEGYVCGQCEQDKIDEFKRIMAKAMNSDKYEEGKENVPLNTAMKFETLIQKLRENMKDPKSGGINDMPTPDSEIPGNAIQRVVTKSPNADLHLVVDFREGRPVSAEAIFFDGKTGENRFMRATRNGVTTHGGRCQKCHQGGKKLWGGYRSWVSFDGKDGLLKPNSVYAKGALQFYKKAIETRIAEKYNIDIPCRGGSGNGSISDPITGSEGKTCADLSPQEKLERLKKYLDSGSTFHVSHYPEKSRDLLNRDSKTASCAGRGQVMFDQIVAQNACRVMNQTKKRLKKQQTANGNFWDAVKYYVAGAATGCLGNSSLDTDEMKKFIPFDVRTMLNYHFYRNGFSNMDHSHHRHTREFAKKHATSRYDRGPSSHLPLHQIMSDMNRYVNDHNEFENEVKTDRIVKIWEANRLGNSIQILEEAKREILPYHRMDNGCSANAIADPGGFKNVREASPAKLAALKYVLDPLGAPPGLWSTSRGLCKFPGKCHVGGESYVWSDQFTTMMSTQKIIQEVAKEASEAMPQLTTCQALQKHSQSAMKGLLNENQRLRLAQGGEK